MEQNETNPAQTGQVQNETNPAQTEQVQTGTDPAQAEQVQTGADPAQAEQIQTGTDPVQAEQEKKPKKNRFRLWFFLSLLLASAVAAGLLLRKRALEKQAEAERLAREADPFIEDDGIYDLREVDLGDGERLLALEQPVLFLDLTGQDIAPETYEKLSALYPEAEIRWTVPIGSARVDSEAESVVLPDTEEATLAALGYLKKLKLVDGESAGDAEPLIALQAAHPEWEVRYSMLLFGHTVSSRDQWLSLSDIGECDTDILLAALENLPNVTDIDLVGVTLTNEQKAMLRAAHPNIRWYWYVYVGSGQFKSTDERIDFTRVDFDSFDAFLTAVGCFNHPVYVDVSTQGFENSFMERAIARYPDTLFAWVLRVGKLYIRTDVTVADLGYVKGECSLDDGELGFLRYLTVLEALSLDGQGISDLSPLSGLKNLKILCLGSNKISDLTPLAGLTELQYLNLSGNKLTDLTALSGLTKLTDLNIMNNDISSLAPLDGLTSLKRVCASKNTNLQAAEQARAVAALPETHFDFTASSVKVAWQDDAVYDTVNEIFTARQMSELRSTEE